VRILNLVVQERLADAPLREGGRQRQGWTLERRLHGHVGALTLPQRIPQLGCDLHLSCCQWVSGFRFQVSGFGSSYAAPNAMILRCSKFHGAMYHTPRVRCMRACIQQTPRERFMHGFRCMYVCMHTYVHRQQTARETTHNAGRQATKCCEHRRNVARQPLASSSHLLPTPYALRPTPHILHPQPTPYNLNLVRRTHASNTHL